MSSGLLYFEMIRLYNAERQIMHRKMQIMKFISIYAKQIIGADTPKGKSFFITKNLLKVLPPQTPAQ